MSLLNSQLLEAVSSRNIDEINYIIDRGADIDTRDKYGGTPIHNALESSVTRQLRNIDEWSEDGISETSNVDIVKILLDRGADIEAKNNVGNTPLIEAASIGDIDSLKALLNRGADIEAKNNDGNTSLIEAKTVDILKVLIDRGADIEAKNNDGNTPLVEAAMYGQVERVKNLIFRGASKIEAFNKKGPDWKIEILELIRPSEYEELRGEISMLTSTMEEQLSAMRTEVSNMTSKMSIVDGKIRNDLSKCATHKDELEDLLRQTESMLEIRNKAIMECESQKSELEQDIAMITSRLVVENSELSDDADKAKDRLRLALGLASRNSKSVQLGSLIGDMSDYMNSGNMNTYQLAVMESILEENIIQATTPEKVELLRIIFEKIKDEVHDRTSSITMLKELESKDFKVRLFTKIGAHMRLF